MISIAKPVFISQSTITPHKVASPLAGKCFTEFFFKNLFKEFSLFIQAAFEMNLPVRAKELINTLRGRAGMPPKDNLTLDLIKNERFVELFAENHHYWDLRTWRDAEAAIHMRAKWGTKWFRRKSDGKYKARM